MVDRCPIHTDTRPIDCRTCTAHRVAGLEAIAAEWDRYAVECEKGGYGSWPAGWGPEPEPPGIAAKHAASARQRAAAARDQATRLAAAHRRTRTQPRRTP